jgi:hypothetical protein
VIDKSMRKAVADKPNHRCIRNSNLRLISFQIVPLGYLGKVLFLTILLKH